MTTEADVRDTYVSLHGLRYHYREWGAVTAPALIVLHGFNSQGRDWDFLGAALADRLRVLLLDQRGHGETDWADDYAPPRFSEDVGHLADALGLAQFMLFGYSVGGEFAWRYAAGHPHRVTRLVVVDQGVRGSRPPQPAVLELLRQLREQTEFADPAEAFALWRAYEPHAREAALWHSIHHNLRQREDGRWVWRHDPRLRGARGWQADAGAEDPWAVLAAIACPTLLVHAAESELYDRAMMERVAATIPDCQRVEIANSTHRIHWHQPEALVAAVSTFLK